MALSIATERIFEEIMVYAVPRDVWLVHGEHRHVQAMENEIQAPERHLHASVPRDIVNRYEIQRLIHSSESMRLPFLTVSIIPK